MKRWPNALAKSIDPFQPVQSAQIDLGQNFSLPNPFRNKPLFLRFCSTSLTKTLWEKEKMLPNKPMFFTGLQYMSLKTL